MDDALVTSLVSELFPPLANSNSLPETPPILAVFKLLIPSRACWLLTTSGPSWNCAPPPLMLKLTDVVDPSDTVKFKLSVEVFREIWFPFPVATVPLIVAWISVPTARGPPPARMAAPNVPPAPSLRISTPTTPAEPYLVLVNSSLFEVELKAASMPVESFYKLMDWRILEVEAPF